MQIDLDTPRLTQRNLTELTPADNKTVDNYIQHGHVVPHRVGGRRLFTPLQAVEVAIIARLASVYHIPPKTGVAIARQVLADDEAAALLREDAEAVGDAAWAHSATEHVQVTIRRLEDGSVELLPNTEPDAIGLIVPVQIFARMVLAAIVAKVSEPEEA